MNLFERLKKDLETNQNIDFINEYYSNHQNINSFGIISTLFSKFLPSVNSNEHLNLYHRILAYRDIRTNTENEAFNLLKNPCFTEGSLQNLEKLKQQPHIITTYHFGIYLMTCALLFENGIEFSALISKIGNSNSGELFKAKMKEKYNFDLNLIEAENPTSVLSMIRELKSGKSLIVFLDGNLGAIEKTDKLCEINFLKSKLLVRKGIAYLSGKMKIPIVTALNFIENETLNFYISNPIQFELESNEETIIMEKLYNDFGSILQKYPEQWEAWSYLHKNIPKRTDQIDNFSNDYNTIPKNITLQKIGITFKFNLDLFTLLIYDNEVYVMNKNSLKSFYIKPNLGNLLKTSLLNPIISDKLNLIKISHLVSQKLLIPN